ncbi:hypothetical protein EJD97_023896 [Solanum chilense]|uniref:Uncharacterized protein n=1 Tax=Solanum chilense TaxID=4083 RepID=A0A6N2ATH5_SOLCI|nr:hypothetical protein EJD97_023896 [Solanum chilense]
MDKGKNIQMELTGEELQRKIEQITREIQKDKEEGLRVNTDTTIYKAANVMLDEYLTSQIKRKKKECAKYPVYEQEANSGPNNAHPGETGEDDDEQIVYKPPFLGRLKGGD